MLAFPSGPRSIHPHIADACRELLCIRERGPICDSSCIEEHHISVVAGAKQSTIAQAEPCRDGAAHLANCVLQCQQFLLTNILRQHTWICAIGSWVCWP